jgi:hypothetical protein
MKRSIISICTVSLLLLLPSFTKESAPAYKEHDADHSRFYVFDVTKGFPREGFTMLDVNSSQQTTEYTCGPSAVITLLNYYDKEGDETNQY